MKSSVSRQLGKRKKKEEILRESAERFRIAAQSASDLIWEWDIRRGIVDWFGNIDEFLGYAPLEFPRTIEAWESIIHPDDYDRVMKTLERHLKQREPYYAEYRVRRKNGTFCHWIDRGTALWDEQGNPYQMIGACEDITERKEGERLLRESGEKFRRLFDEAPVGYHELDAQGRIISVNQTELNMLGYTAEEMTDQFVWNFIENHEESRQAFASKITGALPAGRAFEHTYRRKDGTMLPVLIEDRVIRNDKGQITGIRSAIQDISKRKRDEEALRQSEEEAKRLAQENAVVAEIGRIISLTLNIEEVYEKFAEETKKLIHFDRIAINLHNSEENTVFVPYVSGLITEDRGPGSVFSLKGSVTEEIVRSRLSLLTDMKTLEKFKDRFPSLISTFQVGMRSMLSVPLISRDSVIGALHFWSKKPDAYSGQDLKLAERIANQIAGAISNAQLFRERERTKEALREREEKYRNILETMEEGYFEVDLKGRFTSFNDSLRKMHRLPREKMLGMSYKEYMSKETAQKAYKLFYGVYDTGQPVKLAELEIIRGDGEKVILEASLYSFKNAQGERIGFWGVERDITERKRIEETLRESEKKYRQVVENAQELIHITDGNGNFTFANSLALKAVGYSLDELLRMNYLEVIHPEHRQRLSEIYINQFRERKASVYVELPIISKSGKMRWLGQNSSLMMEGRKVVGFHSVARDITDRKKAEEALRQSEERFRLVAESISDVVYEWDMGNRVQWFGNIDELLGYGPGEFSRTLETWENSLHPDDRDRVMAAIRNHLEKNEPYGTEFRVRKKDGTYNHWWARGTAVRDENGNPYRWVGAVADITERKQAEQALAASEERYRTLFEVAGEGILVADVESRHFKYANPAICRMLGYTLEKLVRLGVADIHPKEALNHVVAEFEAQARGEKTLSPQIPCLRKDGSVIYTDISTAPVVIDGRKCNVGFFMDITDRIKAEKALRRSEEAAKRLAQENAIIAEIGRIISSTFNTEEVYERFAQEVRKLIPFDRLAVNLNNLEEGTIAQAYVSGLDLDGRRFNNVFPLKGSLNEEMMRTRSGLLLFPEAIEELEERFPALVPNFQLGIRSILSVPLITMGVVVGGLHFRSLKPQAYTDQDLAMGSLIADQIAGAIANARLFNELKSSEEALRQSENLLRNVLGLLPVGVGIADRTGKITSTNPSRERIWGGVKYVGIDQYGEYKGWWADTGKKIEAEEWPLAHAIRKGETSIEKMIEIECFDGAKKKILNSAVPIRDPNQEIVGAIVVSQDITERKQAEEQLKRNEEQFRLLIENSSDVIATIDNHQNISYISPSVGRMLGYKPEDLIGQNLFQFIHQDDLKLTMEVLAQVIQNPGITKTIEHRLKHGDGSWPIFQTIGSCFLDESGNRAVVANSRDITERRNLESQLAQGQKLEAIGSLAAGIAHEINTPTQYVGDNTRFFKDAFNDLNQLLQKYEELGNAVRAGSATDGVVQEIETIAQKIDLAYLTEEIPKAIHQTLEGVERVTKIVQAMKEFSHPGAKEKTPININKAIENTIIVARNEWKYVAELVTDLDPSMPLVPCLPGEFNQVILNMIINAAHAIADVVGDGSAKKGTITMSTRPDGNSAEVRISDTGTGIPENIRPRIFDPFFTTKKVGKGTGQGLAISHSVIVDKHGGTIHFDTDVGKGTTFIIRLPLENLKMEGVGK